MAKGSICLDKACDALPEACVGETPGTLGPTGVGCIEPSWSTPGVDMFDSGIAVSGLLVNAASTCLFVDVAGYGTVSTIEDCKGEGSSSI